MDPFRSERLVYTTFEKERHNEFVWSMHNDNVGWLNSSNMLPRPMDRDLHELLIGGIEKKLLFVVINKLATSPAQESNTSTAAEDLEPVGAMALDGATLTGFHHRGTTLGITIHQDYQGQGYGTEAVNWAVDWAFNYANVHRVGLQVFEWNNKAFELYKRLGFKEEGRRRECLYFRGRYWDNILMSILAREWKALRGVDVEVF